MTITPSSLAAGNLVSAKNVQFAVGAQVIPQKIVIIGNYDAATFPTLPVNVPIRVYSPDDVASQTGRGFMLHRLAIAAWKGGGVETWIIPQAEAGGAAKAAGVLDFSTSTGVVAGTIYLYINGEQVLVNVTTGETATAIGDAVVAAIAAMPNLPVLGVNTSGSVAISSKQKGTWGNGISLKLNLNTGDVLPTGVVCTITAMTSGTSVGSIAAGLNALGTGDGQNENNFTCLIHGYGSDTTTLDAISTYNGIGNQGDAGFIGNYKKEVARPFRSLIGDVTAGSAGLTAALAISNGRTTDRTSGMISVPGSASHPQEIAAQVVGIMAVVNSTRAEEGYINQSLDGVWPGAIADRWTADYSSRDLAVQSGLSTSMVKNGVVYAQNIITFYHPSFVNPADNGYRAMRNISILQNLLYNYRANFNGDKWQGITLVADTTKVSDVTSKEKARDVDAVIDDLVSLADVFSGMAWLYSADYTKKALSVNLRAGLTGFDIIFPVILSGEGGIFNTQIQFDTSIAILLGGN